MSQKSISTGATGKDNELKVKERRQPLFAKPSVQKISNFGICILSSICAHCTGNHQQNRLNTYCIFDNIFEVIVLASCFFCLRS